MNEFPDPDAAARATYQIAMTIFAVGFVWGAAITWVLLSIMDMCQP